MNPDRFLHFWTRHFPPALIILLGSFSLVSSGLMLVRALGAPVDEEWEQPQTLLGASDSERVDVSYCNCRKMRFLGHGGMKICKERFGNLSVEQEAQMTRRCRTGPVQDPLADALLECSTYDDSFMHPFTGEPTTTKVLKHHEGECEYTEDIPGGLVMVCVWPSSRWQEMSEYFRYAEFFLADVKMKSRTRFENGEPVTETTYMVDEKPWHNPLQASLDNGACQVIPNPTSKDGLEKK